MSVWNYSKDKGTIGLVNLAGMFFLSIFLKLCGNSDAQIQLIIFLWLLVEGIWFVVDYQKQKKKFEQLFALLDHLEKPYLIAEVMEASPELRDQLYREALRISNRSVIEKIHELEDAGKEYREYMESWVHEVKLPLTAAKLMCENEAGVQSRKLLVQLERIEKQVDQVLFYARMEHAYKDYLIHRVNLREMVAQSVASNKNYFIQKRMQVSLELPEETPVYVSTDEKWVGFMLDQIFSNAMKYAREQGPMLRIYERPGVMQHSLVIEDNGIGIGAEDLPRVFEKGFTGKNGRNGASATGIGLYLCRTLCEKLGMGIVCESQEGQYTRIILTFPDTDHVSGISRVI